MAPRPLHQLCGQCDVEQCGGIVPHTRVPPHPYTVIICPQNKPGFITKHNLLQSVTFHIDLAWHHCNGKGAWIKDLLLQGVKKLFVEQLLRLRLLVSLKESLWDPQVLAARSFDPLSSWSSWSLQIRFSARGHLLVFTAPNNF
ncbi:hypothetical protein TNCV_1950591 [Trichonephila clavipes]|nr:hypothetical protein TNCV_1950591 [Trichonephila clavipes]